jgi:hypothetical protein
MSPVDPELLTLVTFTVSTLGREVDWLYKFWR